MDHGVAAQRDEEPGQVKRFESVFSSDSFRALRFWKITDFCIEHLIRMAKKSDDCYKWLAAHPNSFEWINNWIKTNPRPPR